jgi:hypothetical protein
MNQILTPRESWFKGFTRAYQIIVNEETPSLETVEAEQFRELIIIMNMGREVENGIWTLLGSRMATYMLLLTQWDCTLLHDHDSMEEVWSSIKDQSPEVIAATVGEELITQAELPIFMIDEDVSKFIRIYLMSDQNL